MASSKKKNIPETDKLPNPAEQARNEAEEDIAEDPEFSNDPASDDLDEGELANLDNSND